MIGVVQAFVSPPCLHLDVSTYDSDGFDRHFGHERTRRHAYYSLIEQEWKAMTCLTILATDWVNRARECSVDALE